MRGLMFFPILMLVVTFRISLFWYLKKPIDVQDFRVTTIGTSLALTGVYLISHLLFDIIRTRFKKQLDNSQVKFNHRRN